MRRTAGWEFVHIAVDTVESGIESVSAISAAVIRSRRSFTIAASRPAEVLLATRDGADDRSSSS